MNLYDMIGHVMPQDKTGRLVASFALVLGCLASGQAAAEEANKFTVTGDVRASWNMTMVIRMVTLSSTKVTKTRKAFTSSLRFR